MASIITRTIGSEEDRRVVLNAEQMGRTLSIGSEWGAIRIGVRFSLNRESTQTTPPQFQIGMCSGTTKMIGDPETQYFVGVYTGNGTATWDDGNKVLTVPNNNFMGFRKHGTTQTDVGLFTLPGVTWMGSSPHKRGCYFFEIHKAAPGLRTVFYAPAQSIKGDITQVMFDEQMIMDTVNFQRASNIIDHSDQQTTFGSLDTINVSWKGITNDLEISDISYARIR